MNFMSRTVNISSKQLYRMILQNLGTASEERMIQLTHLGERLTKDEYIKGLIAGVRGYLRSPGHSAPLLWKRVCEYLPLEKQVKLFHSLFHNALIAGKKKRAAFAKENGFKAPLIMILSPTSAAFGKDSPIIQII